VLTWCGSTLLCTSTTTTPSKQGHSDLSIEGVWLSVYASAARCMHQAQDSTLLLSLWGYCEACHMLYTHLALHAPLHDVIACAHVHMLPSVPVRCCMLCCACARQTALAWYYLQLGNRIMVAHVHYDLAKEQRNLGHIRSLFRAPFTTSRLQDRTAVFVVGMPRSGSTLVEQMLASHPQV
jgi:hypothetical protein